VTYVVLLQTFKKIKCYGPLIGLMKN
jgi:hypothetical protein